MASKNAQHSPKPKPKPRPKKAAPKVKPKPRKRTTASAPLREAKLTDLQPDARNANLGTERGAEVVRRSLEKLGAGRSILVDKHGRIIAGNKTAAAASTLDLDDVLIVRSDGKRLVVVQRDDLDLDDPTGKARELAYADNRASELSLNFDPEILLEDIAAGLDLGDMFTEIEIDALDVGSIEEGKEFDETAADDVEFIECPHCGKSFPK